MIIYVDKDSKIEDINKQIAQIQPKDTNKQIAQIGYEKLFPTRKHLGKIDWGMDALEYQKKNKR